MIRQRLIDGNPHLSFVFGLGLATLLIVGCDPDWALKLAYGTPVPDMRFDITPIDDLDPQRLYPIFESIAEDAGYFDYKTRPLDVQLEQQRQRKYSVWGFEWYDSSGNKPIHRLAFRRNSSNANNYDAFTVILGNGSTDDFDVDDWLVYKDWSENILPAAFPNADIRVSRHPASFTATEDLEAIADQAEMPIPAKHLERLHHSERP